MDKPASFAGAGVMRSAAGVAGVCLLLIGLGTIYRRGTGNGFDFKTFYYPAAVSFLSGRPPYVAEGDPLRLDAAAAGQADPIRLTGNGLTPTQCAVLSPLGLFSESTAGIIWMMVVFGVFLTGVWLALLAIAPEWSVPTRILLLGLTACAGSVRWSADQLQMAPLAAGGMGIFLYAEARGRSGLTLLGAMVALLKLNMLVPVAGLLLWRGKLRMLALLIASLLVLDVAAAARMGFRETYAGWLLAMSVYSAPGSPNDPNARARISAFRGEPAPAPSIPGVVLPQRFTAPVPLVHWTHMLTAFTSVRAANLISAILSLAALAGFVLLWRRAGHLRSDPDMNLRAFAALVYFGLLCVSHIYYDMVLLVYPFFIALHSAITPKHPTTLRPHDPTTLRPILISLSVSLLLAYAMMHGIVYGWWMRNLVLPGERVWLVPLYSYILTLGFVASLAAAWRFAGLGKEERVSPTVGETAPA